MSTYLQLSTQLRQLATDAGTGPTTVTGQTGELARFVTFISDYYVELQAERDDWLWLRKSFTVNTVAGTGEYAYTSCTDTATSAAIARFSSWYKRSFKAYLSSGGVGGEYDLVWMDWDDFKRKYRFGTLTNGVPRHVSMDPTMKFALGPKPDAVYVVSGDFNKGPQVLAADADEPEMPSRFHKLVAYGALMKYGLHRVAPEAIQLAQIEGARLRFALERDQLPPITTGGSLA